MLYEHSKQNGRHREMKLAIKIVLLCVLVLILATIGAVAFQSLDFTNPINMTLNGEQFIILEYGQKYQEPGATAAVVEVGTPVPTTATFRSWILRRLPLR